MKETRPGVLSDTVEYLLFNIESVDFIDMHKVRTLITRKH